MRDALSGKMMGGWAAIAAGAATVAACWWLTVSMAVDFYHSSVTVTMWQNASFGILLLMWAVMMAAMMAPAALPFLRLFWKCGSLQQTSQNTGNSPNSVNSQTITTAAAAAGYALPWLGFSLIAAALHKIAADSGMLSDNMLLADPHVRAALFAAAGIYQLTPLKHACLRGCRPPALFLILHWKSGVAGAVRTGAHNGLYCVGCCWALMLLLFAGGVMDLRWIAALALVAVAEKILPITITAKAIGGGLLFLAVLPFLSSMS